MRVALEICKRLTSL